MSYISIYTTDETNGNYITEFVSAGQKNYAYKLGLKKWTIKGFTQNITPIEKINIESIKRIVCENQKEKISVQQLKFSRDKQVWNVLTEDIDKSYGFVYDKRILKSDLTTLPYGY